MKFFGTLYDRVMDWARHRHAVRYLSAVSFAESSFFPVPVAIMLLPMAFADIPKAWKLAGITTFWSVLGGILGYIVGVFAFELVEPMLAHYAEPLAKAKTWFGQYGAWVVLMAGFSPIPYKVFTLTAGALGLAFIPFVIASIIGRASQFYLIAALVTWLGPGMEPLVKKYVEWIGWAVVALIMGIIAYMTFHGA